MLLLSVFTKLKFFFLIYHCPVIVSACGGNGEGVRLHPVHRGDDVLKNFLLGYFLYSELVKIYNRIRWDSSRHSSGT